MKEEKTQNLNRKKLLILIYKKAIPAVIAVVAAGLYNLVDTYFVSHLGNAAVAGVSVGFAGMAMIQTIGYVIGMGGASIISNALGEEKQEMAASCFWTGMYLAALTGGMLLAIGIAIPEQLMYWLGATKTSYAYALEYGWYIILAAPIMVLQFTLTNFLRALGNTRAMMHSNVLGAVVHIVLCWVLVSQQKKGVSAAGMATLAGQFATLLALLWFCRKANPIIKIKNITKDTMQLWTKKNETLHLLKEIVKNGIPSLCRQGSASLAAVVVNRISGNYSDALLGAVSIAGKLFFVVYSVAIGISQGYQPIAGYLYGAKEPKQLRRLFHITLWTGSSIMTILAVMMYWQAPFWTSLFYRQNTDYEMAVEALQIQAYILPFALLNNIVTMTSQTFQKPVSASVLSAFRQGICYIPVIYLGAVLWGEQGIIVAQPLADLLTFFLSIPFAVRILRELKQITVRLSQSK